MEEIGLAATQTRTFLGCLHFWPGAFGGSCASILAGGVFNGGIGRSRDVVLRVGGDGGGCGGALRKTLTCRN